MFRLGRGGGGEGKGVNLFAQKNYVAPDCLIVDIGIYPPTLSQSANNQQQQ